MSIRLGDKVSDAVTGVKGLAWARVQYLTCPDQIGVMLPTEDGKPGNVIYVEEERLLSGSVKELQALKYGDVQE